MYFHMEIFKRVDIIVTPTTGYVKEVSGKCGINFHILHQGFLVLITHLFQTISLFFFPFFFVSPFLLLGQTSVPDMIFSEMEVVM